MDTNTRDTAASIFGHNVAAPIGFAPIGINRIYHPTGELSVAKVANELNLPYTLSSAGSYSIEDVAKANISGSPRFFQLYQSHDDELCVSMLERAFNNGYDVCILTTDTWQLAWRHHDVATGNYAFYHEHGAGDIGLQDPVFQKRIREAGLDPEKDKKEVGAKWIDENIWHGKAHSWEKLPWVMGEWKRISGGRPFCLKGIQSVADAKKAVQMGVDGIVVSNHAGRQVDGAIASLDALEDIVDAVGNDIYVSFKPSTDDLTVYLPRDSAHLTLWIHHIQIMYDSGIRGAADIFKALAIGAKFVFIGRLWVWGLSIAGEHGVRHVMKSLLAEFDILLNCAGFRGVSEIDRDALKSLPNTSGLISEKSQI